MKLSLLSTALLPLLQFTSADFRFTHCTGEGSCSGFYGERCTSEVINGTTGLSLGACYTIHKRHKNPATSFKIDAWNNCSYLIPFKEKHCHDWWHIFDRKDVPEGDECWHTAYTFKSFRVMCEGDSFDGLDGAMFTGNRIVPEGNDEDLPRDRILPRPTNPLI
jgi:hypothetical protein